MIACQEFENDDPLDFLTWPVTTNNRSKKDSLDNPIPAYPVESHSDSKQLTLQKSASCRSAAVEDFREALNSLSANPGRCAAIRTRLVSRPYPKLLRVTIYDCDPGNMALTLAIMFAVGHEHGTRVPAAL